MEKYLKKKFKSEKWELQNYIYFQSFRTSKLDVLLLSWTLVYQLSMQIEGAHHYGNQKGIIRRPEFRIDTNYIKSKQSTSGFIG